MRSFVLDSIIHNIIESKFSILNAYHLQNNRKISIIMGKFLKGSDQNFSEYSELNFFNLIKALSALLM